VFSFEQMALLHRHENEWRELREVPHHTSSDDEDLERRLLRGERVYRCAECDLEIVAAPPQSR
jgi:hypothetical protein